MADEQVRLEYVVTGQEQVRAMSVALKDLSTVTKQLYAMMRTQNSMATNTQQTANAVNNLTTQQRYLTSLMRQQVSLTRQVAANTANIGAQTSNAAQQAKGLLISWHGVSRIIIGSLISRGIGALLRNLKEGAEEAIEFQIRISEMRTISQQNQQSFYAWADAVRDLSDAFGSPLLEVAEAHYQTLSNQIAEGAEATKFATEAQRFALISVSKLDEAVNLLSASLNAYGESSDNARRHADVFFKMIDLGRLRAQDIHSSFGQVQIVSSQLGVSLEELSAAMATLTIQGLTPSQAMTGLRNVMLKLIRPTDYMREIFDEWGVASGEAAIQTYGFIGVMRMLAQRAEDSGDPLDELGDAFGRIRAIVGAAGLTGAFNKFEDSLKEITNSAEEADAAFEIMQESAGFKLKRELQRLGNVFVVDLGMPILEALSSINESIGGFANRLQDLVGILKYIAVAGVAFLATKIYTMLIPSLSVLATTLAANAVASGATSAGLFSLSVASQVATLSVARLGAALTALMMHPAFLFAAFAALGYKIGEWLTVTRHNVAQLSEEMTSKIRQESEKRIEIIRKESDVMVEEYTDAIKRQTAEVDQLLAKLLQFYNELKEQADLQLKLQKEVFEAEEKTLDPLGKANLYMKQYVKYKELAQKASDLGNLEQASDYLDEMASLAEKLGQLDKERFWWRRDANIMEIRGLAVRSDYEVGVLRTLAQQSNLQREILGLRRGILNSAMAEGDVTAAAALDYEDIFKKLRQQASAHKDLEEAIKTELGLVKDLNTKASSAQEQLLIAAERIKEHLGDFAGDIGLSDADRAAVLDWSNKLNNIIKVLQENKDSLLDPQKAQQLRADIATMQAELARFQKEGISPDWFTTWGKQTPELLATMQTLATVLVTFQNDANAAIKKADELRAKMPDFQGTVNDIYAGYAKVTSGLVQFADQGKARIDFLNLSMNTLSRELENLNTKINIILKNANDALAAAQAAAQVQPKWTGGYMSRFASGGSVGSDTVPALLSPGEFVMNKNAARQYLPQLVAMNSGSARFNSGGDVVNNNIGDINVTVQGGDSSDTTVRRIASSLRRELKRGTVRLN